MDNVVAHITARFPDNPPEQTITDGDLAEGKRLYNVCAYCHGKQGEGLQALNAPRLAGMSDWYLKKQLENFRDSGIRGAHPQDYYGFQMGLMSKSLR